jgi:hypothetical protein
LQGSSYPSGFSATTNSEGGFVFEQLEPGSYSLLALRTGYLGYRYGTQSSGSASSTLSLSPRQSMTGIELKMVPQGVITGKAVDDQGDPVENATVRLFAADKYRSQYRASPSSSANTNDLGEFRLPRLPAGQYILGVIHLGYMTGVIPVADTGQPIEGFLPTYFPSVTTPEAAAPIQLTAGQELAGITVVCQKGNFYRVRGVVTNLVRVAGGPEQLDGRGVPVSLRLESRNRSGPAQQLPISPRQQYNPDGSFVLTGVPPGSYFLTATQVSSRVTGYGRALVDVTSRDVENVVVAMTPPIEISGTVRVEGQSSLKLTSGSLMLSPIEGGSGAASGRIEPNGAFKLEGLLPQRYRVNVIASLPQSYVKSFKVGNEEVLEKGLDLTLAQPNVTAEIVLSTGAATIEGLVKAGEEPAGQRVVNLVPDPPRPELALRAKTAMSRPDGRYSVSGVAPGNYRLYAWEETPGGTVYDDPDFLKLYESQSVKISVSENDRQRVDVTVVKPKEDQRK